MKFCYTLLLFSLSTLTAFSQVGIGNTDPKASLDISAKAVPDNTDGILIPRIDDFPTPVPTAAQDGMMVFTTGNGAPTKGFYYWDQGTTSWVAIGGASGSDDDWYEEGTTNSPTAITDNIVTQGSVTVGNSLTGGSAKLNINSNDTNSTSLRIVNSGTIGLENRGITITNNTLLGTSSERFVGVVSELSSSDDFSQTGFKSEFDNMSAGGFYYGVLNEFQAGTSNGYQRGFRNYFGGGETAYGVENVYPGAFTYSGTTYGMRNTLQSEGNGVKYGVSNSIHGSGSGNKYGTYTSIDDGAGGTHYGLYMDVQKTNSYAAYLIGRTSLGTATTNRYLMPAADGVTGQVMTTDGSGNIMFESIIGDGVGAKKIDDLSDAKSDNDGSDDGSSIFLGVNSGAADDSSNNANVGIGYESMFTNTTGNFNNAVGWGSLRNNDDGSSNTAIGYLSLSGNTSGSSNTAVGMRTLNGNGANDNNTALGADAMYTSGGANNVAVGKSALFSFNGSNNTAIGLSAGEVTGGNGNIFIGYQAGSGSASANNRLFIENTNADADNALIYGNFGTDNTTTGNILRTNSEFQIGNPTGTGYAFPTIDGASGQVLTTDGAGNVAFQTVIGGGSLDDAYDFGGAGTGRVINTTDGTVELAGGIGALEISGAINAVNKTGILANYTSTTNQSIRGIEQNFNTTANGTFNSNYGVRNTFRNLQATSYGFSNSFSDYILGAGKGFYGFSNYYSGGDFAFAYGYNNSLPSAFTSNGTYIGYGNTIESPGTGNRTGFEAIIRGSGTGFKYGVNINIDATGGGTHYGIYSNTQKSSGYAGYFIGRTSLGEATTNRYLMPPADGSSGQVLTTNGAGVTSWNTLPSSSYSLVKAQMTTSQSLPATTWTKLQYDSELFDINNEFNISNNNFVAANGGYFRINGGYYFPNDAADGLIIAVYVNGTKYAERFTHTSSNEVSLNVDCLVNLAASDIVEIYAYNPYPMQTLNPVGFENRFYFEIQQIR